MKTKKKLFVALALAAVVLLVWLGVVLLSGNNAAEYNRSATDRAQASKQISQQDILILKSLTKNAGEDTKAEFYVYRLPEGAKAEDYLHLQVSKVSEDSGLVHMGSASCTFVGDDPSAIYDLKVIFLR